ncbi:MAG: RIP metalloprotease RseP [Myxococcales bacterium]|nr:RIP metalloprotease RseP [Myxococcales bacterium]
MSVIYFLVLIGVLVVIHEFGHFIAAKLLGFKVMRFSLGFGQPLLRIRGPETEYQLALFPLGGYVRILGEDPDDGIPDALAARAWSSKPIWQRLIVVFAGPFANFCLPIAIYFVTFAGDTELPAAVVGDVLHDTPADRAGIEPGDEIISIDGDGTRYWHDVEQTVHNNIGSELRFKLRRAGRSIERFVTPIEYRRRNLDGPSSRHGHIGITQAPFLPQVGVIDSSSPAGRAGLRTGDLILSVDGSAIDNWRELQSMLGTQARRMNITYVRGKRYSALGVTLLEPKHAELITKAEHDSSGKRRTIHGLAPAEMFVASVEEESPVDLAGLRPGDLVTRLDEKPVRHWMVLKRMLQGQPDREWKLSWQRSVGGKVVDMSGAFTQVLRSVSDEYGNRSQLLVFGAHSNFERGEGTMVSIDGPIRYAASRAVEHGGEAIGVMASSFFSVLRGQAPSDELGGPIMMFRVASVSGAKGWEALFLLIALVSISVGLINLLPIPVLDGGHILIFVVEAIWRRPLAMRTRERINVIGLALIAVITILALSNDVVRYIM